MVSAGFSPCRTFNARYSAVYPVRLNHIAGASPTIRSDVTEFSLSRTIVSPSHALSYTQHACARRVAHLYLHTQRYIYIVHCCVHAFFPTPAITR